MTWSLKSDTVFDRAFTQINHIGDVPFMSSGASPLLNVVVKNMTVVVKDNPRYCLNLTEMRNSLFENITIIYIGSDPSKCRSLIRLKAKSKGCHYNIFRNIRLFCNQVPTGFQIFNSQKKRCNDNHFSDIFIYNPGYVGLDERGCIGNTFNHISVEGNKSLKPRFGIYLRRGHHNTVFGYYIENALEPTHTNEFETNFYGGYERR